MSTGTVDATRIRKSWETFVATGNLSSVRSDVGESWARSIACGVDPFDLELPYDPNYELDSRLLRAALPALARFEDQLEGENVSFLVCDRDGRVIYRWAGTEHLLSRLDNNLAAPGYIYGEDRAGTNGLGTVLETNSPILVRGAEHFAQQLHGVTCAGEPIRHPGTARAEGVIDITTLANVEHPLMRVMAKEIAQAIELNLLGSTGRQEQFLIREFSRVRKTIRRPVWAVSADLLVTGSSNDTLGHLDRALVWDAVVRAAQSGAETTTVRLVGDLDLLCRPIWEGRRLIGAILELQSEVRDRRARRTTSSTGGGAEADDLTFVDEQQSGAHHVVIAGEPGTGKWTLLKELAGTGGTNQVLDMLSPNANDAIRDLDLGTNGAVAVRHLEEADLPIFRELMARVETARSNGVRKRVLATVTSADLATPLPQVFTAFFDAVHVTTPLRFRRFEVPGIARNLLTGSNTRMSPEFLDALSRCEWPGNLTQLKRAIEEARDAAEGSELRPAHLPAAYRTLSSKAPSLQVFEQFEAAAIEKALRLNGNSKDRAAAWLGFSRATFYRKLARYRITSD